MVLAHNGGTKLKPPRKFLFKGGLSKLLSGTAVYPLQNTGKRII